MILKKGKCVGNENLMPIPEHQQKWVRHLLSSWTQKALANTGE